MFKDIVVRRYLLSSKGMSKYIIAIGERHEIDSYVMSKFGANSIASSEDLDGSPIILPSLTNEAIETNMLNKIFYT